MRRFVAALILALAGFFWAASPAFAGDPWGNVSCSQMPTPDCQLMVGGGGDAAGKASRSHNDSSLGRVRKRAPHGGLGDTIISGGNNVADCSYVRSDYRPPASVETTAAVRSAPLGAWYLWKCSTSGVADGLYHPPMWFASGRPTGAVVLPSPASLARVASSQLRLPVPLIAASPAGEQLVNLPTWLWLSGGWGTVSATASVPGVSVTAVATPTVVTWSMGDGSVVTCFGAGKPFQPGTDPKASSPDCGHTYRTSSASQPSQAFPVNVTVRWTVSWSGAGQSGTFPNMTTAAHASFRVAESQALNFGS